MKKIIVIDGHPDKLSFGYALVEAYRAGAAEGGAQVEVLRLIDLNFDPILRAGYREIQPLEPDLVRAQDLIRAADHLVVVYPSWWVSTPALLKGFFDRAFLPGFAFKYHKTGPFWDQLLKGKTGRIIHTMDAPVWYWWWMYGKASIRAVKAGVLEFCGVRPVAVTVFGLVKGSTEKQRTQWLTQIQKTGQKDAKK
jgi:putative NADPH-quinone reductase